MANIFFCTSKMYLLLIFCLSFISSWGQPTLKTEPMAGASGNGTFSTSPKTFALLIGVSNYSSSKTETRLSNLKFAEKDVQDFRAFLDKQYGKGNVDIKAFTNENATYSNILPSLRFATKEGGKNYNRVIILFSGHGGTENLKSKNSYLYLNKSHSLNEEEVGAYKYSMDYLRKDIYNLLEEGKSVTVILDACHAGGFYPEKIYSTIQEWKKDSLSVNFLACLEDEKALEIDDLQNGLLVHFFIKGAEKGADFDLNSKVSLNEMRTFLNTLIPAEAQRRNHKQTPLIIANNDNFIISIIKNEDLAVKPSNTELIFKNDKPTNSTNKTTFISVQQTSPLIDSSKIIKDNFKKALESKDYNDAYQLLIRFKDLDSSVSDYQKLKYDFVGAVHKSSLILSGELVDFVITNFFDNDFKNKVLLFDKSRLGLVSTIESLTKCLSILDEKEPSFQEINYRLSILKGIKEKNLTIINDAIKINSDIAYPYLFLAKVNFDTGQNVSCLGNLNEYEDFSQKDKRIADLKEKLAKIIADSSKPSVISKSSESTISIEKVLKRCKGLDFNSRTRIAVGSFKVTTKLGNEKFGDELATMLGNALVSTECFQVLASTASNAMKDMHYEKEFNRAGDVRADKAAMEGQMLGAQLLVIGEVTEFSEGDDGVKVAGVSLSQKKAKVGFIIQIVNPRTREIVFSRSINMEASALEGYNGLKLAGLTVAGSVKTRAMADAVEKAIIKAVELIVVEKERIQGMPQGELAKQNTEKLSRIQIENIDFKKLVSLTNIVKTYTKAKETTKSLKESVGSILVIHEGSVDELAEFLATKALDFEIISLSNGQIGLKEVKK